MGNYNWFRPAPGEAAAIEGVVADEGGVANPLIITDPSSSAVNLVVGDQLAQLAVQGDTAQLALSSPDGTPYAVTFADGGIPQVGAAPFAFPLPAGATIEDQANTVTSSGTYPVITVPADTPLLAFKLAGDAYPRLAITADPGNFAALNLGDGTSDPFAGVSIGLTSNTGDPAADLNLALNAPPDNHIALNRLVYSREIRILTGSEGLVLTDRSDGHTYRLKVDGGVLGVEQVT